MKNKTILLVGGCGFIGHNLALYLKKKHILLNKGLFFRLIWQYYILAKEAKVMNCDLLFVPGGLYIGTFKPFVTMSRNLLPFEKKELFRYGFSFETLRLLLLKRFQIRSFKKADGLIFLNEYAKRVVLENFTIDNSKVEIIPHGINKMFLHNPKLHFNIDEYKTFKIIYVSIIDVYKHQVNIVKAVDLLRKKTSWPLSLDLIGPANNEELKKLSKIICEIDPNQFWVKYLGKKEHNSLKDFYNSSDLGVFASTCENMPNILLEKVASGLPVVTSNHGANFEILGNDGVYFNSEDPLSIMNSLYEVINSKDKRQELAEKSFNLAKKYNWETTSENTFKFLIKVANDYHGGKK